MAKLDFLRTLPKLDKLARKARPYVPFTALNTVWQMMDKESKTLLDVGCGKGEPMRFINYIWSPREMKRLGYEVKGIELRGLGGKSGIQSPLPSPLRLLLNIIWVLAGPLAYFFPSLAGAWLRLGRWQKQISLKRNEDCSSHKGIST